jgi:hypothetical protein
MEGKTVVRYVLYFTGKLAGDTEYSPDEIAFTWDARYYDAPLLTIPIIEDFFKDEGLPRSGGCFFVGKGKDVPRIPETRGMDEITSDWPPTREGIAKLLNGKKVFYSYDGFTSLLTEARRCGCEVVVVSGEDDSAVYEESIKSFESQIDNFISITQGAVADVKVSFGALVNDMCRLNMCLRQSHLEGSFHIIKSPDSATKGLNKLLGIMEGEGADVAVLAHQDMFFGPGWLPQVKQQLAQLPDSWIVAGVIGKDMGGAIKGKFHDMRVPLLFNYDPLPCGASCFDECVIIVNLKKGFRFDETLEGFDLYGTLCVLQAQEMGGTAWIIDAFAEHYCMRPFTWYPDKAFEDSFKWLHTRFPNAARIDSTVLGVPREVLDAELEKEMAA